MSQDKSRYPGLEIVNNSNVRINKGGKIWTSVNSLRTAKRL